MGYFVLVGVEHLKKRTTSITNSCTLMTTFVRLMFQMYVPDSSSTSRQLVQLRMSSVIKASLQCFNLYVRYAFFNRIFFVILYFRLSTPRTTRITQDVFNFLYVTFCKSFG